MTSWVAWVKDSGRAGAGAGARGGRRVSRRRSVLAAGLVLVPHSSQASPGDQGGAASRAAAAAARAYGQLPLAFQPNRGQADQRVRFLARGGGSTVFLTKQGATVALPAGNKNTDKAATLSLIFAGANPAALVGRAQLPREVNYLTGTDPSQWRTGVPTYARVAYQRVWPGIDAVFYGNRAGLEYDFNVAPGADPGRIALSLDGARSVRLTPDGALAAHLPGGVVRMLEPQAYQVIDGAKQPVPAHYALSDGQVGIRVGSYDRQQPLVIDPVLAYSTYLGGSGPEFAAGIAVDSHGAAYITGAVRAPGFPTKNPIQDTLHGDSDAFVAKLAPDGQSLVYSTYLGGSSSDRGAGIAVDKRGAAYVTGLTGGPGFPTTANALQERFDGGFFDGFVTKLAPNGQSLAYSTYLGGSSSDYGNGIAVDNRGAAYVVGITDSTDFPTRNAVQGSLAGSDDGFVAKLAPNGQRLEYSTYLGGSEVDQAYDVVVGHRGTTYLTGETFSADFPTTKNAVQGSYGGIFNEAFVAKLAPGGRRLAYSTYLGGSRADSGSDIAVAPRGTIYVSGATSSHDFPTTENAVQASYGGGLSDAFVAALTRNGRRLVYSTYLGGSRNDVGGGTGMAVHPNGTVYVTANTQSRDFPTTQNAVQGSYGGGFYDGFVTKIARNGRSLVYSSYLGGSRYESPEEIAVRPNGTAYITGVTASRDFPTTENAVQGSYGGGGFFIGDAFVTKLDFH